jgi:hypothetical protein
LTPDGGRLIAGAAESHGLFVWDLRLIRRQLNAMGMDWELPPLPAEKQEQPPLTVQLDTGTLR